MRDHREQVEGLAELMDEFKLQEATLKLAGFSVRFSRRKKREAPVVDGFQSEQADHYLEEAEDLTPVVAPIPAGHPVSSPMAGIFYLSSSPGNPPFIKLGEQVAAGQTLCLIEAMKVFNDIPSPVAGTVLEICVENSAVVQPGQVLIRIG